MIDIDDGSFDDPYFWLGAFAEEIAAEIRGQKQQAIEAIMRAPTGFDLSDPCNDE